MAVMTPESFAGDLAGALGGRLVSLLLYGSAARGAPVRPRADVNTLLLADAVDEDLFARLDGPLQSWIRTGNPAPLILTELEWRSSADAFPIEYADIRESHRLLAGRDPWEGGGITVRPDDVRRQLERELMGQLVHLRQAYAALRNRPGELARLIEESAGGFFTMLRALLRLQGGTPPPAPDALLREAAAAVGFAADAVAAVLVPARDRGIRLRPGHPLPAAYLAAVTLTAEYVNRLSP